MAAKSQAKKQQEKSGKIIKSKEVVEDGDALEDSDEESGVDEEGLEKLMKALGEKDLDDIAKMQLDILGSNTLDENESDSDNDEDEEDEDEDEDEDGSDDAVDNEDVDVEANNGGGKSSEEEEDDEENEVALDDVDSVDEDAVPRQKLQIDNKVALERIRETIKLDPKLPWTETLVVTYPEVITVDANDDLNRELAFYKQALDGANKARDLAQKHGLPFTRPSDYFAEMVKSDSHMERIRQRLLDEKAVIKKSEDRRKEKEGKKFGKQIQLEKMKERERGKKEMTQKLKDLKRKRKDILDEPNAKDDAFDVAVENAISDRPLKKPRENKTNMSRRARDSKFGFGSRGKWSKQNTRASTEQFNFGRGRGGRGGSSSRGGSKRLGKSRRITARGK